MPAAASKPSPCGGAVSLQPIPRRRADAANKCRREAPLPLKNRIRPGLRMTCSSWIAGSDHPGRIQVPFEILLHRSGIPFPVAPYLAPAAVAELGSGAVRPLLGKTKSWPSA